MAGRPCFECFETSPRQTIASARNLGSFAVPWSRDSAGLLWQAAMDGHAISPSAFVKGGMGALTQALAKAAVAAGAEIRTGAEVETIQTIEERAAKVVLRTGEEISARAIVSNADPRMTFLQLIDPADLDPAFSSIQYYRAAGFQRR